MKKGRRRLSIKKIFERHPEIEIKGFQAGSGGHVVKSLEREEFGRSAWYNPMSLLEKAKNSENNSKIKIIKKVNNQIG